VAGTDWLLRPVYDLIAPFHDLGVDVVLPIIQYPDPSSTRQHYIDQLELHALAPRPDGPPLRLLEVGIGAGANLSLLEESLPDDLDVELWGLDLSHGMLRQCRRTVARRPPRRRLRVVLADAHALPFPDAAFDRVFHVGAINGYRDRRQALAEMARVARPGTPIVVVDEGLDPTRPHSLLHHAAFLALTAYDRDPRAPVDALPRGAHRVSVTAVSRFYYCLRFET
jgi:ubiquinone/menaquinone biosynthesis C-methylase UbiE